MPDSGGATAIDAGTASPGCIRYCAEFFKFCGDYPSNTFTGTQGCLRACATYPVTGIPSTAAGDSLECRLTHLSFITDKNSAIDHCQHVGEHPKAHCVPLP